jgi:hypothetical protein
VEGLYLYGIVGFPPELSGDMWGLGGYRVRLLPHGKVAAVVSHSQLSAWPMDETHLTLHEAVVEEVMRSRPILPVRFNSLLESSEALIGLLERRSQAFLTALERLAGKVEMGLRVLWNPPQEGGTPLEAQDVEERGLGTAYLHRRLKEERRRAGVRAAGERLIQEIQAPFLPLAVDCRLQRFPTDRCLFVGAYLVRQDRLDSFREAVGKAREKSCRLRLFLTGPWPPYHFVNGGAHDTGHLPGQRQRTGGI